MPTAPARRFATSRQKRSGIYQEGESKDTKLDMKSSTIDEASVSASSESPLINTRQPPPPQLLLPNTDLTSFAETPSLMRDTPYTTLEDLQRGIEIPSDDTELLHNAATPSSSSFTDLYDPNVHLSATTPTDWRDYEAATPLWQEMAAWIGVAGRPISVADYMRQCLTHPAYGYYTNAESRAASTSRAGEDDFDQNDWDNAKEASQTESSDLVIGGDFVTAPEMSQIFGECLGIFFMTLWQLASPRPATWQWLEGGPGKGSLMVDLIRFTYSVDKIRDTFGQGCRAIHWIEQSPKLRQVQRESLQRDVGHLVDFVFPQDATEATAHLAAFEDTDKVQLSVHWHDSLAAFQLWQKGNDSYHATFGICQEFLDALPVYAFEKTEEGWRERLVDIAMRDDIDLGDDTTSNANVVPNASSALLKDQKRPRLRLVTAPEVTPAAKTLLRVDPETGLMPGEDPPAPIGTVLEVNPEGILLAQEFARIVDKQGGGALVIDYGQEGSHDSIRAFARHEQVHFLSRPGQVDVTADVDFAALRNSVNSLGLETQAFGPVGQGDFLMAMGAQDRAIHLIENENTSEEEAENVYQALVRLCDPAEMGERFKVMAIAHKKDGIFQPPGF
jgi:NADH dehydrogenase [ubiquinone] 1 alpha subcomplex assembly factor 7